MDEGEPLVSLRPCWNEANMASIAGVLIPYRGFAGCTHTNVFLCLHFSAFDSSPGQLRVSGFEFRTSFGLRPLGFGFLFQRRPDAVDVVVVVEGLEELTHLGALRLVQLWKRFRNVTNLTGHNFPAVLR